MTRRVEWGWRSERWIVFWAPASRVNVVVGFWPIQYWQTAFLESLLVHKEHDNRAMERLAMRFVCVYTRIFDRIGRSAHHDYWKQTVNGMTDSCWTCVRVRATSLLEMSIRSASNNSEHAATETSAATLSDVTSWLKLWRLNRDRIVQLKSCNLFAAVEQNIASEHTSKWEVTGLLQRALSPQSTSPRCFRSPPS